MCTHVHVYVGVDVFICTRACTHTRTFRGACTHTRTHVCAGVYMRVHARTHVLVHVCTCENAHMRVCKHARGCVCMCREWGFWFQSIWVICRQTGASAGVLVSEALAVAAGGMSRGGRWSRLTARLSCSRGAEPGFLLHHCLNLWSPQSRLMAMRSQRGSPRILFSLVSSEAERMA